MGHSLFYLFVYLKFKQGKKGRNIRRTAEEEYLEKNVQLG